MNKMNKDKVNRLIIEIKRVLKKRGFLIATELVHPCEQKGVLFKFITYLERKFKHIHYYDSYGLQNILSRCFYEIHSEKLGNNISRHIFTYNPSFSQRLSNSMAVS